MLITVLTLALIYTDMQSDFDDWQRRAINEPTVAALFRASYHRAQVYASFADPLLEVFPQGLEYEAIYGVKDSWPQWEQVEPYILRDQAGNRLYMKFACDGTQCSQWAADFGNEAVSDVVIERIADSVAKGYRGVWLDNVDTVKPNGEYSISNGAGEFRQPIDPTTGALMTEQAWQDRWVWHMGRIRAAFPDLEIAINPLWFARWTPEVEQMYRYADIINLENVILDPNRQAGGGTFGFDTLIAHIRRVQGLGLRIILDNKGPGTGQPITDQEFRFALAAYWLVREPGDMFGIDDRNRMAPDSWAPLLTLDLGEPEGPPFKDGELWRRTFTGGAVVVDPVNRAGSLIVATPENTKTTIRISP